MSAERRAWEFTAWVDGITDAEADQIVDALSDLVCGGHESGSEDCKRTDWVVASRVDTDDEGDPASEANTALTASAHLSSPSSCGVMGAEPRSAATRLPGGWAWSPCAACKKVRPVEKVHGRVLLEGRTFCRSCEMDFLRHQAQCPETIPVPGGVSACSKTWSHDGRCEPHDLPTRTGSPPVEPEAQSGEPILSEARGYPGSRRGAVNSADTDPTGSASSSGGESQP